MKLVLGLGNPGTRYSHTRHNIGFLVLDALRKKLDMPEFSTHTKLQADTTQSGGILLAKPTTFMNESGRALDVLQRTYTIQASDIVVVHDDLDIPFGNIKLHMNESTAGHNGLKSLSSFVDLGMIQRLRVGIAGSERGDVPGDAYVLSRFTSSEQQKLTLIIDRASDALVCGLQDGWEKAAQTYNQKTASSSRPDSET